MTSLHNFNADFGYLEGIVRGYKNSVITQSQYLNLTQCETMEGSLVRVERCGVP